MVTLDRPKLRPLSGRRVDHQGQPYVALEDSLGLFAGSGPDPARRLPAGRPPLRRPDDPDEIQSRVPARPGRTISLADLESLVEQLDRAMVLEGPTFGSFRSNYARLRGPAAGHAGRSYPGRRPDLAGRDLDRYFAHPDGSGRPRTGFARRIPAISEASSARTSTSAEAGRSTRWAYKELVERSDADVFVILGVAHQYCRHRFALTRKDFETPLGTGQDRPRVRRPPRRGRRVSPVRGRAGPSDRAFDRVPGRLPPVRPRATVAISRSCRSSSARSTT